MNLTSFLFDVYGSRGRKTDANGGACVQIDDQNQIDIQSGFCQIHVTVQSRESSTALLELSPAPHNGEVSELLHEHGGQLVHGSTGATIRLSVGPRDARRVRDLARAIRRITRRGETYADRNWKWICRRTADSLEQFARVLADAKRSRIQ